MERVALRAEQLRTDFGDAVTGIAGDVARIDDTRRAVAETVRAFGQLDVFVGNAGVFDVYASFAELSRSTSRAASSARGRRCRNCERPADR